MTAVATRLRQLERRSAARDRPATIRVLFDEELTPCAEHRGCFVEGANGIHHTALIRLTFGEPTR